MAVKKKGVLKNRVLNVFGAVLFFLSQTFISMLIWLAMPLGTVLDLLDDGRGSEGRRSSFRLMKVWVWITAVLLLISLTAVLLSSWQTAVLALLLSFAALVPALALLQKMLDNRSSAWHRQVKKAIDANDLPALEKLLANRDVNRVPVIQVSRRGYYALRPPLLYLAARKKNLEIITLLFEHGADPNMVRTGLIHCWDPLWVAMHPGNEPVLDCFLSHGVNVNRDMWFHNRHGSYTQPLIAAVERENPALIKKLLRAGADINHLYDGRNSPLSLAIEINNLALIQLLLDEGADPNLRHRYVTHSPTPLYTAAHLGHETAVALLLAHGADPNTGIPAIIAAIDNNHQSVIDQLLPLTRFDGTAAYEILAHTIQAWNLPLAEKLLAQNPSLKHPFSLHTESLVYLAVEQDHPALLNLLLEHGAEPHLLYEKAHEQGGMGITTEVLEFKSPLALAIETNQATCRQILLEYVDVTAVAYKREVWENGERHEEKQQTGQQLIDAHPAMQ